MIQPFSFERHKMATKERTIDLAGLEVNVGEISVGAKGSTKTATSTAGAVTFAGPSVVITTESLTTAALATYTLTITNSYVLATDIIEVTLQGGTSTTGTQLLQSAVPTAGQIVVKIYNAHATVALNGTLVLSVVVIRNT